MARARREIPPPLELHCLRALWQLGEGAVKDVRGIVGETRPLAYTTILTVLDRLTRKGKLSRRRVGRAFIYKPVESRESLRRAAVRELLESFFDGSEAELLRFLQGEPAAKDPDFPAEPQPDAESDRIDTVLL